MNKTLKTTLVASLLFALSALGFASNSDHVIFIDAGTPNLTVNTNTETVFASATSGDTYSAEADASDQAFKGELEALGIAAN